LIADRGLPLADALSFITDYAQQTLCTWKAEGEPCGVGMGGAALVVCAILIIVFSDSLKDAAKTWVKEKPLALVTVIAVFVEILYFKNGWAAIITLLLLTMCIVFTNTLSNYRVEFSGRTISWDNASLLLLPVVYLAVAGVAMMKQEAISRAAVMFIPSPNAETAAANDLRDYIMNVRNNVRDHLDDLDVLPTVASITDFPGYLKALAYPWTELPPRLRQFEVTARPKLELVQSNVINYRYSNGAGLILTIESRSYDPAKQKYGSDQGDVVRFTAVKADNTIILLPVLASYLLVKQFVANDPNAEARIAAEYMKLFRNSGGQLTGKLPPEIVQSLASSCATFACVDPIEQAYRERLDLDYAELRDSSNSGARGLRTAAARAVLDSQSPAQSGN